MQLVHTLFKLILLSETSQLRLHPSLHHSYYKVRSVYYSVLNLGLVQSGLFWVLKSVTAKKHRIKPPRHAWCTNVCYLQGYSLCERVSSAREKLCLISKYEWTPSRVLGCELACAALACDVVLNLYCSSIRHIRKSFKGSSCLSH